MGILTNTAGAGYVDSSDNELDRQLREGDGLAWAGDPDLWLGYGVITAAKPGLANGRWYNRGDVQAKRYEVWRHCEDGQDRLIAHWLMHERDRILYDLTRMRAEAPGHESVIDSIEAANAEVEDRNSRDFRDAYGELLDHKMRLEQDIFHGKTTFRGMPGRRDQASAD